MTKPQGIIEDILGRLRGMGQFAEVHFGSGQAGGGLPRANVELLEEQSRQADDGPAIWRRLRLAVVISTAGHSQAMALGRAMELGDQVRQALLQDRFRGGRAQDLPWGMATEFAGQTLDPSAKPPSCRLRLEVNCHMESSEEPDAA